MTLFAIVLCFSLLVLYALYEQKQWEKQLEEIRRRRQAKRQVKLYRKMGRMLHHVSWVMGMSLNPVVSRAIKAADEFAQTMKAIEALTGPITTTLKDPTLMTEEEIRQAVRDA